jgi:F-type H+-transporting ATPase subunit gamma
MANLRDVRLRMRAIEQTLQVTKAMNLISTAKLRKGRRVLEDTEPFFKRIQKSMCDILAGAENVESEFFGRKQKGGAPVRTAILAVTSDKGLAGGYNADIFRKVSELAAAKGYPLLILIGAIGYRYFAHTSLPILENFSFRSQMPEVEDAKEIADYIISQYLWGMLDEVYIVYTHMYSAVRLLPTVRQILPLRAEEIQDELARTGSRKREELHFEYLPSQDAVFDALVPLYIKGIIYGSLVEAYASEQNARMAAMEEASKNAEDMLADLRLHYNRTRQAGITLEISEIISGAEALEE